MRYTVTSAPSTCVCVGKGGSWESVWVLIFRSNMRGKVVPFATSIGG
jgi:hypothetical protein